MLSAPQEKLVVRGGEESRVKRFDSRISVGEGKESGEEGAEC